MVGIPLLIDRLGKVLDSAVIPMGVVTGVKARFCILQSWRYSEWCLSWEDFFRTSEERLSVVSGPVRAEGVVWETTLFLVQV